MKIELLIITVKSFGYVQTKLQGHLTTTQLLRRPGWITPPLHVKRGTATNQLSEIDIWVAYIWYPQKNPLKSIFHSKPEMGILLKSPEIPIFHSKPDMGIWLKSHEITIFHSEAPQCPLSFFVSPVS